MIVFLCYWCHSITTLVQSLIGYSWDGNFPPPWTNNHGSLKIVHRDGKNWAGERKNTFYGLWPQCVWKWAACIRFHATICQVAYSFSIFYRRGYKVFTFRSQSCLLPTTKDFRYGWYTTTTGKDLLISAPMTIRNKLKKSYEGDRFDEQWLAN